MARSPGERYGTDHGFRTLVDALVVWIRQHNYSPSEVREAAMLASVMDARLRPLQVVVSEACPPDRWVMIAGPLSEQGQKEREYRVSRGEDDAKVLGELLGRERKAATGQID